MVSNKYFFYYLSWKDKRWFGGLIMHNVCSNEAGMVFKYSQGKKKGKKKRERKSGCLMFSSLLKMRTKSSTKLYKNLYNHQLDTNIKWDNRFYFIFSFLFFPSFSSSSFIFYLFLVQDNQFSTCQKWWNFLCDC